MPEDDRYISRLDQAAKEAAIADFLKCFEVQEKRGYWDLDAVLSRLLVLRKVDQTGFSLSAAMEAGMLPRMEDEEERRFTPSDSEALKCFCTSMPKIAGVLTLGIFGLHIAYILVNHGMSCSWTTWTVEELREAIALLQWPEFNPTESRRDASSAYTQHPQTLLQELQGYSEDTSESLAAEQSESEHQYLSARVHIAARPQFQCYMRDRYSREEQFIRRLQSRQTRIPDPSLSE